MNSFLVITVIFDDVVVVIVVRKEKEKIGKQHELRPIVLFLSVFPVPGIDYKLCLTHDLRISYLLK